MGDKIESRRRLQCFCHRRTRNVPTFLSPQRTILSLGKLSHGQVQGLKITAYSLFGLLSLFRSSFHIPSFLSSFDCCLQYCLYKKGIFSLAIHQRHGLALPFFLWFLSQYALPVFYRLPNKR